mgnify:CR=1 FL=1
MIENISDTVSILGADGNAAEILWMPAGGTRTPASPETVAAYGEARFQQYIQPYIDQGVMSIFQDTPNRSRSAWATPLAVATNVPKP